MPRDERDETQVGIDEGHYEVIATIKDNDADYGPCTGQVISNGIGENITIYSYKNDPKRISLHIGD
jgi:hypothetical protein